MPTVINSNTTLSKINIATQKADAEAQWKALAAGIASELGDVKSFVINQEAFTKEAVVAKVQLRLDAAEKTKTARAALHALVAAERAVQLDVAPLRVGLKQFLQSRYGKTSPELQKFGFTPAKVPQRSAVAKASGVAKAQATRKARGTQGKKQKSQIKGTVAASTAPATTAAAPSPAPAAKPASGTGTANAGWTRSGRLRSMRAGRHQPPPRRLRALAGRQPASHRRRGETSPQDDHRSRTVVTRPLRNRASV